MQQSQPSHEQSDVPVEFTYTPVPLIGVFGLDVGANSRHATLWNCLAVNRAADRTSLYFNWYDENQTFPAAKPKKSSYEWHIPKGILKSRWVSKHLFDLPAVAILFVDLDWDDEQWENKTLDCSRRIDTIKRKFIGRNTKVVLVLIQKSSTTPGDESVTVERAPHLCNICEIHPGSLFVLPYNDDPNIIMPYIIRFEGALLEYAKSYFQAQYRTVKNHRDQLNKTTHSLLFVRHEFKMGFYSELRLHSSEAIKHYTSAYTQLMEVRPSVINLHEIKTIAAILTYKICKLLFPSQTPLQAINHFRRHLEIFRTKNQPEELLFEHHAWLSKQYSMFANQFSMAVTNGLMPSQTQNPGVYFYEAALETIMRRRTFQSTWTARMALGEDLLPAVSPDSEIELEFIGQRPWRQGCQSIDIIDLELERKEVFKLLYKESLITNHSATIIYLLSTAASHFKKHKCLRLMRYVNVLMAEEYSLMGDYANALAGFNQILPFYREEPWKPILSSVLDSALKAAYSSINIIEFFRLAFEYLAIDYEPIEPTKVEVQNCVQAILIGAIPVLSEISALDLRDQWAAAIHGTPRLTIVQDHITSCIAVKARFEKSEYSVNDTVIVELQLLLNASQDLSFNNVELTLNDEYYNSFCKTQRTSQNSSSSDFILRPFEVKKLSFEFRPRTESVGKSITLTSLMLKIGQQIEVTLLWNFAQRRPQSNITPWYGRKQSLNAKAISSFYALSEVQQTTINPPPSNLVIQFANTPPAYYNEYYPVRFTVTNSESSTIRAVRMLISCNVKKPDGSGNVADHVTKISSNQVSAVNAWVDLCSELAQGASTEGSFEFEATSLGSYEFSVHVNYETENPRYILDKIGSVTVEAIAPLSCTFSVLNIFRNQLRNGVRVGEPFILRIVSRLAAADIELVDDGIALNSDSIQHCQAVELQSRCSLLQTNSEKEFLLECIAEAGQELALGYYQVDWRRSGGGSQANVRFKVQLPSVPVASSLVYVECSCPKSGVSRTSVPLTFTIHNRSEASLPLELSMGNSDNFMFSGNKQIRIEIEPKGSVQHHYVLYPLVCGYVALPKLRLVAFPDTVAACPLEQVLEDLLPSNMQIMPKGKSMQ